MPFAGYKDFAECVRKNQDKGDPEAYCGSIKNATEEAMNKSKLTEWTARETLDLGDASFEEVESKDGKLRAKIRIIKAGLSKNNRNYRVSALQKAAKEGIFNGVPMFINHAKGSPMKRSYTDMVSAVESTEFNAQESALDGTVEFFDQAFYDRAKRAQKYTGVSIHAMLSGTRTPQVTGRALEDIHAFTHPHSVDWVLHPAAGGQILAFEDEDELEGEEQVDIDWAAVEAEIAGGTLSDEDLKKNLPTLYANWKGKVPGTEKTAKIGSAKESEEEKGDEKNFVAREDVAELVKEAISAHDKEVELIKEKQEAAAILVREAFATSGLPTVTRSRVMAGFEGVQEYDEKAVKKAIDTAKEELKAVGAGPRITGMGPSGTVSKDSEGLVKFSVRESVEAAFGSKPKEPDKKSDDPKEGDK